MSRLNFPRSCILISDENYPSQRSAMLAGFKSTDSVVRLHRVAHGFRFPDGAPPAELQPGDYFSYFAAATAHFVLNRG